MATVVVPASFQLLPAEVLLNIALFLPDLPSLYALDRASTHFALVFNEYGSQILEWVMCTTESDRAPPHQLHEVIRLVAHVRVMCLSKKPSQTLDAITGQIFERTSSAVVYKLIPLATPPSILREILAVATTIAQLAPLCLATHMRRCLALRPSHPADRSAHKPGEFSGPRPAYLARPGYTYTPHSAGPPSWLELERVKRALWTVQLYLELCRGVATGRIMFASGDSNVEALSELDVTMQSPRGHPIVSGERAVRTVVEWLSDDLGWRLPQCKADNLEQNDEDTLFRLPDPPKQGMEQGFDWDNEGKGWFPGCEEKFDFQYDKLNASSLMESPGEYFLDSRMWSMRRYSPAYDISGFPIFRRLGVAFWDSRRLMGLELLGPFEADGFAPDRKNHFKYFSLLELAYTWISIADAAENSSTR